MNRKFADHFSPVATNYANYRPIYPAALFAWLAQIAPGRSLAWDCAAGNGQASVDLAGYFRRVVATDASAMQIAAATPHPNVEYRVAPAEAGGLPNACADLIAVAQALHWFDRSRFYGEARRVLVPRGIIAAWTYGVQTVADAGINEVVQHFYSEVLGPYWPPQRTLVETGYRTLPFPFQELPHPPFSMETSWNLPQLLGYFGSWSATARFIAGRGHDPVEPLARELGPLWGEPQTRRTITWPLSMRVGRKQ